MDAEVGRSFKFEGKEYFIPLSTLEPEPISKEAVLKLFEDLPTKYEPQTLYFRSAAMRDIYAKFLATGNVEFLATGIAEA